MYQQLNNIQIAKTTGHLTIHMQRRDTQKSKPFLAI